MENDEMRSLVEAFRGYRELLSPIQESLKDLSDTYDELKSDLEKLGGSFDGSIHTKLDKIYETLSGQTKKSVDLAECIDRFNRESTRYSDRVGGILSAFDNAEKKLKALEEIEEQARVQLQRLTDITEEKKVGYNVKELQKSLENYNTNVQRVSDYINKEVAGVLMSNTSAIESIRQENENISRRLSEQHGDIVTLVETFKATESALKKVAESGDVNEAYIFDVLDRWASSRGVKTKK